MGSDAASMEAVADRIVRYLYESLTDGEAEARACALVRCYKTHPYANLEPGLQSFARTITGTQHLPAATKCLTLLATAGDLPVWNVRQQSDGHQAIPLLSEELVLRLPMVSQLVSQFGLEVRHLLAPDPALLTDLDQRLFNVFFVADALGSPYVPAQAEFVVPQGIRSVLGFGGMLPSGDLVAIILFARVAISREVADRFKSLALSAKLAVLPFINGPTFASELAGAGEDTPRP
jgi:hypothetical protein